MADFWTALVVFVTTDIDDLILLTAFFGDARLRRGAIVGGQFLGIGALMAVSVAAAAASLAVPPHWPALLGAVPLLLGLGKLPALWRRPSDAEGDEREGADRAARSSRSQALAVAAVTVANGGDNLGVYIPLFSGNFHALPVYVLIFALMTGVWCMAARAFVKHPAGAALMARFGHAILPIVLILLGLWILSDARFLL
jgi:cadmium resistance protein CadD (predicted permease)